MPISRDAEPEEGARRVVVVTPRVRCGSGPSCDSQASIVSFALLARVAVSAPAAEHDPVVVRSAPVGKSRAAQWAESGAKRTEKLPSSALAATPPGTKTRRARTLVPPVAWHAAAPVEAGATGGVTVFTEEQAALASDRAASRPPWSSPSFMPEPARESAWPREAMRLESTRALVRMAMAFMASSSRVALTLSALSKGKETARGRCEGAGRLFLFF